MCLYRFIDRVSQPSSQWYTSKRIQTQLCKKQFEHNLDKFLGNQLGVWGIGKEIDTSLRLKLKDIWVGNSWKRVDVNNWEAMIIVEITHKFHQSKLNEERNNIWDSEQEIGRQRKH